MYQNMYSSIVYHSQNLGTSQMSANNRMDKEIAMHAYSGILYNEENTIQQ